MTKKSCVLSHGLVVYNQSNICSLESLSSVYVLAVGQENGPWRTECKMSPECVCFWQPVLRASGFWQRCLVGSCSAQLSRSFWPSRTHDDCLASSLRSNCIVFGLADCRAVHHRRSSQVVTQLGQPTAVLHVFFFVWRLTVGA